MAAKLLVYGSLNIDYVYQVPHFVQPGETLLSSQRNVFAGGKGLNQAVALARAGGNTFFAGAVGLDDGKLLVNALKESNIDTSAVQSRANEASGHTFIQVDASGQNCILLYGGSNRSNTKAELDAALANFGAGDYLVLQNETNDVDYIMEQAAAKGLNVCLNASPLDSAIFKMPLDLCKYIIVNEIEGSALVDVPEDTDTNIILDKLTAKYPNSHILLTLGSRGSVLALAGSKQLIACKAYKVEAVDTTAAGDTFLGYFIEQLSEGNKPEVALQRATAASAIAVTRPGATPSIPTIDEVLKFLETHAAAEVTFSERRP